MSGPGEFQYVGRVGGEPIDLAGHFYRCGKCGQPVDKRDLGQVLHHDVPGHAPIAGLEPPPPGVLPPLN